MNTVEEKVDHARQNAEAWAVSISEMVAAMQTVYKRNSFADNEDAIQRIQESVLSVQVRSGWHSPGKSGQSPEEFEILLTTGGPACRIMGELDEHNQPKRAWLEYQDWGTSWTDLYVKDFTDDLLAFCRQFYFGK